MQCDLCDKNFKAGLWGFENTIAHRKGRDCGQEGKIGGSGIPLVALHSTHNSKTVTSEYICFKRGRDGLKNLKNKSQISTERSMISDIPDNDGLFEIQEEYGKRKRSDTIFTISLDKYNWKET